MKAINVQMWGMLLILGATFATGALGVALWIAGACVMVAGMILAVREIREENARVKRIREAFDASLEETR